MGFRHIFYLLTAWLMAILYIACGHFADPDLWGRLSIGALFFQNGQFPYQDVFSYTASHAAWIDHEWLTGMVFYQILSCFGETGFLIFKYSLILSVFYWLFRLHRKVYQASPLYALYGLIATVDIYSVGLYATLRSQVFSFVFFVLFMYVLERVRLRQRSKAILWTLPVIGLVWGNLHGGFIMGVLLLAIYGAGEAFSARHLKAGCFHWLVAGSILLVVGLINPYGLKYLSFLLHAWSLDRSHIGEWSAMRFDLKYFLPAQLLMMGITIGILWRGLIHCRQSGTVQQSGLITPVLVLLWMVAMTCKGVRFQPFLAFASIAYAPIIFSPEFLRKLLPTKILHVVSRQTSAFSNTLPILIGGLVLACIVYMQTTFNLFTVIIGDELTLDPHIPIRYPLAALNYLKKSPYRGNLAIRFGFGEFAYWLLYPRFKVSMDGRYEEVYSQAEFLRNDALFDKVDPFRAQKTVGKIDQDHTDFVLAEATLPNVSILLYNGKWQMLYADDYYALLGRISTLKRYKPYHPTGFMLTDKVMTISDFVTPADLKRFKNAD